MNPRINIYYQSLVFLIQKSNVFKEYIDMINLKSFIYHEVQNGQSHLYSQHLRIFQTLHRLYIQLYIYKSCCQNILSSGHKTSVAWLYLRSWGDTINIVKIGLDTHIYTTSYRDQSIHFLILFLLFL